MSLLTRDIVGYSAVVLFGYSIILIGIHMYIPHPSVTKKVMTLSYTSLTLLTLAQACIVGTYFIPHVSGLCVCGGLWSAALVFYVFGLYTLKFVYIERISILNKHPMLASPRIQRYIKYVSCSLMASCLICVTMMVVLTDGECHQDLTQYGCKPTFHAADVYLAIAMISFDAILFTLFCYKWWSLIKVFRLSSDSKVLIEMIQSFAFQFLLTVCAMLSCVIDGIINLWHQDYSTLIVFCVDSAIIASCTFAMIKESQAFMWKYVCWPCRMPSFLLRGTGVTRLASRTNVNGGKTPEPSRTGDKSKTGHSEQTMDTQTASSQVPPEAPPKLTEMVPTNSNQTPQPPKPDEGIEIVTSDYPLPITPNVTV